mmetsp:Transcript_24880/g.36698  ORF Transcript_24880/g.36698 Transcript_24880/m.36698 type:complete len:87 (-) Transcript_24880:1062-1322(-)
MPITLDAEISNGNYLLLPPDAIFREWKSEEEDNFFCTCRRTGTVVCFALVQVIYLTVSMYVVWEALHSIISNFYCVGLQPYAEIEQ